MKWVKEKTITPEQARQAEEKEEALIGNNHAVSELGK
jgi:hypothetical protein